MARSIDQYGQQIVQARPKAAPLVNPAIATPDAFGAAVAEGISRGARGIGDAVKLREQEETKRDEVEAFDAFNQFIDEENDRRAEYLTRTGKNALELPDIARADHDKARDSLEQKLTRPGSKERFRRLTERRWTQTDAQIQGHTRSQAKQLTADTFDGTIKRLGLDAINDGSPEALEQAENMRRVTRQRLGQHLGTDGQTLELQHRADAAGLYGGAIESAIQGKQWVTAKGYLDRFGDRLDKPTRDALEGRVRDGGVNQAAQDTADTIFRSGYATTKADADKMVSVIPDEEIRRRTQVKVDQEWARREAALADERAATYESMAKEIEAGESVDDLLARNGNAALLTAADRSNLRAVEGNAAIRREPPKLSDRFYGLRNMAAELPDEFMAHDFRLERGRIPEAERGRLMEAQADMRAERAGKAGKGGKALRGLLSVSDVARNTLQSIKIPTGTVDGERDPRAIRFERLFDKALLAHGGAENLDSVQMQKIADDLLIEKDVAVPDGGWLWFDSVDKVRTFELENADRLAFTFDQIPAADRERARAALVKRGITDPSPDQVLNTYNRAISAQAPQ